MSYLTHRRTNLRNWRRFSPQPPGTMAPKLSPMTIDFHGEKIRKSSKVIQVPRLHVTLQTKCMYDLNSKHPCEITIHSSST